MSDEIKIVIGEMSDGVAIEIYAVGEDKPAKFNWNHNDTDLADKIKEAFIYFGDIADQGVPVDVQKEEWY